MAKDQLRHGHWQEESPKHIKVDNATSLGDCSSRAQNPGRERERAVQTTDLAEKVVTFFTPGGFGRPSPWKVSCHLVAKTSPQT